DQQPRNGGTELRDAGTAMCRGDERFRERGRVLMEGRCGGVKTSGEFRRLDLVGLGKNDLKADCGGIKGFQYLVIGRCKAASGVDEHIDPLEVGAAPQIGMD